MRKGKIKFRYTARQLEVLRTGYQAMNARNLTAAFNRRFHVKKTEKAIIAALKNHGIKCGRAPGARLVERKLRVFTEEQIRFLRDNYRGRSGEELRKLFNRRFTKTKTLQQIRSAVHNRGITSGRTGKFPKGNRPWNAGTKGQGLTGRNKASFKKGNTPANRKPLGTERLTVDGYVEIKIVERNPYTGRPTRYKLKHVVAWEAVNGPVPAGHCLIFADGDPLHCEKENLLLVSRAELLRLNKHGYKDAPAGVKSSILALAKLEVKTFSVRREKW